MTNHPLAQNLPSPAAVAAIARYLRQFKALYDTIDADPDIRNTKHGHDVLDGLVDLWLKLRYAIDHEAHLAPNPQPPTFMGAPFSDGVWSPSDQRILQDRSAPNGQGVEYNMVTAADAPLTDHNG